MAKKKATTKTKAAPKKKSAAKKKSGSRKRASSSRGSRSHASTASPAPSRPSRAGMPHKNKVVAGLLGIFLGGFGIHKFYLGYIGWGVLYILFSWTFVPAIVGFIEGIMYLTMTDAAFTARYG